MPQVGKHSLAQFIRTNCLRQLALNLRPDNARFRPERTALGMPYPQSPRPGLRQIQEAGDDWQAEKLNDLTSTFGPGVIVGLPQTTPSGQVRYQTIPLQQALGQARPFQFLVEAELTVESAFKSALGITGLEAQFGLEYARLRPDIVAVLPANSYPNHITPDGSVVPLSADDQRLQLRIIDIKMTAEPSPSYFAEVAYYSMALAGWLIDASLTSNYVVIPDAAVWPGTHEASELLIAFNNLRGQGITPTVSQLWEALNEDLEPVPFEVFSFRVKRFFQSDVPFVLSRQWQTLEWHVDNRCSFCEYLGEARPANPKNPQVSPHPDHCLPTAESSDHLSRVAFISQGARLSLSTAGVTQVLNLAQRLHTDPVFDTHQALRATRTVVAGRAISLQTGQVAIPPVAGTSSSMPRWADLRVYLSVNFDIGSAITVAFGLKAFWVEPRPFQSVITTPRATQSWQETAQIVIDRNPDTERHELLAFLQKIHEILTWCQQKDAQTVANPLVAGLSAQRRQEYRTSVQFYIWDTLQFEHLARVIGRHLPAILSNQNINYLSWLFPPEDLLPNPEMAVSRSCITVVRDVVKGLLAVPVPHYYSLLEVARTYHDPGLPAGIASFNIHPLFGTPLSDQIPSERAHEIWSKVTAPRHWQQQMNTYAETVRKHLVALETVTKRLASDLGTRLAYAAPIIEIGPPLRQPRISDDGQLWYSFSCLHKAIEELEVHQVRAMPPHERAARFHSARLTSRLTGAPEQQALTHFSLGPRPGRLIYQLAADSRDVKMKVGDFSVAISPALLAGFLDRRVPGVVRNTPVSAQLQAQLGNRFWNTRMEELLQVTIVGLDRNLGLVALDLRPRYAAICDTLENAGIATFSQDVVLDPVHHDFFTDKLLLALRAIGNPPTATGGANPGVRTAMGHSGSGSRASGPTPPADFLWDVQSTAAISVPRNLVATRTRLTAHMASLGFNLNPTQWQAWEASLTHRARLIWGPPGTGKSLTLRLIVVGAVLVGHLENRKVRVLVSATTYNAIDNVLIEISRDLATLLPGSCDVYRVRSSHQPPPGHIAPAIDAELDKWAPSHTIRALRTALQQPGSSVVVGAPPEQVHNLLTCNNDPAQAEWFDLIVIDEASQMDVAHAVLPLCAATSTGAVVLAGDHLQLPPIHQAEPPMGLEDLVGSVYLFWLNLRHVPECALDINYRSNDTIVSFARHAGYRTSLSSYSPSLRIDLLSALPTVQPANWPSILSWTPEWNSLLSPSQPACCFVYDDGKSSQRNAFEADAVSSLLWLLNGRLSTNLRNENDRLTGAPLAPSAVPIPSLEFWKTAVGVVTPHRAQQGLIVSRLHQTFGATGPLADAIRDAVDTVERFQGQERDIIVASYTLGDPDQIAQEDEFLMSLNRFNVIASRARAKLIVLVSQEVINHLAHDLKVLQESRLLKVYAESFCRNHRPTTLCHLEGTAARLVQGTLRTAP